MRVNQLVLLYMCPYDTGGWNHQETASAMANKLNCHKTSHDTNKILSPIFKLAE